MTTRKLFFQKKNQQVEDENMSIPSSYRPYLKEEKILVDDEIHTSIGSLMFMYSLPMFRINDEV